MCLTLVVCEHNLASIQRLFNFVDIPIINAEHWHVPSFSYVLLVLPRMYVSATNTADIYIYI